ncbi:MAG: hypothetical protein J0G35_11840 [Acidobacteriales bacterium]|nr:hypothetical protein [Terriglobales bacterium]
MPDTTKQNEHLPIHFRTHADWQKVVMELAEATKGSDSGPFAYWLETGYLNQRLLPDDAHAAATVAAILEGMSHGADNPKNDVRPLILGAIAFAYARTNDVRADSGEQPYSI